MAGLRCICTRIRRMGRVPKNLGVWQRLDSVLVLLQQIMRTEFEYPSIDR